MKPSQMFKKKPFVELKSTVTADKLMQPGGGTGIIDFWAPWCAPCLATAPHFEAVATRYAKDQVSFYKVNTEEHPALGQAFNIRSLPTMLFIHDGQILDVHVGALNEDALSKKAEWLLSKARGETFWDRLFKRKTPE